MQKIKPNPACTSPANTLEELTEQAGGGVHRLNMLAARVARGGAVECYTVINHGSPGDTQSWLVEGPGTALQFETANGGFEGPQAPYAEKLVLDLLANADWFGGAVPYYDD